MEKSIHPTRIRSLTLTGRPALLNSKLIWGIFFVVLVLWSLSQTNLSQERLINSGGYPLVMKFLEGIFHPNLSGEFLLLTLKATITTLTYAVLGIFLSVIFGVLGGVFASQVWWEALFPRRINNGGIGLFRTPWFIIRAVLAALRAIHEIIWALFFVNIIGLDPLTAVLAISIPFGAINAKVFSEILDETPRKPLSSLLISGASPIKSFLYSLIPLAFPNLLSYSFYRFECAIRAAAVLGIIGAGGLGYEIFLSLQTLKYDQIWTLLFALFLLNGVADYWSSTLRRRIGTSTRCSEVCLDSYEDRSSGYEGESRPQGDPVIKGSLLIGGLLVTFSFVYLRPELGKLFSTRTLQNLVDISVSAIPLDFAALPLSEWINLSSATLAMSILAVAGAGILGVIFSYLAANNIILPGGLTATGTNRLRRIIGTMILITTRGLLLIFRSVPPPIWALIFLFILFPGILPGAAALGLYTLGVLGRLMAEAVENMDERPLEALRALGAGGGKVFVYGIFPLTFTRFLGFVFYRWEEAVRATVVVGLVGAGGLGRHLSEHLSSFDYRAVLTTLVIFIGITFWWI